MSARSRPSDSLAAQVGSKASQLTRCGCGDPASETVRIRMNPTSLESPRLESSREYVRSRSFNNGSSRLDIPTVLAPHQQAEKASGCSQIDRERIASQIGDKIVGNRGPNDNESALRAPKHLSVPLPTERELDDQRTILATSAGLVEDSIRVRHRRRSNSLNASNPDDAPGTRVGAFFCLDSTDSNSHSGEDRGQSGPLHELSGLNSEPVVVAVATPASLHQLVIPAVDGFSNREAVYAVVDGMIIDETDEELANARVSKKRLQWLQCGTCVLFVLAIGVIVWIVIVACASSRTNLASYSKPTWVLLGSELSVRQSLKGGSDELPEPLHFLGKSVAMSGNGTRVAISAPGADNGVELNVGEVVIFDLPRGSGEWLLTATIKGDRAGGSSAESSISLSKGGSRLAVGRPTVEAGEVEIYDCTSHQWRSVARMVGSAADGRNSTSGSLGWFGHTISLSSDGTLLSVGAPLASDPSGRYMTGLVSVFEYVGSDWLQLGSNLTGTAEGDLVGWSTVVERIGVRVRLVIGCPGYDGERGIVRVLEWTGSAWVPVTKFEGDRALLRFGESLSVSSDGRTVAVGARGVAFETGQVYVYRESGKIWDLESVPLVGIEVSEGFGSAVSLSGNGDVLAVGAPMSSSFGTGGGRVAIFKHDGSAWRQDGRSIGRQPGDEFGSSVALATDGKRLVVGAPSSTYDGRVGDSGCALIYGSAV